MQCSIPQKWKKKKQQQLQLSSRKKTSKGRRVNACLWRVPLKSCFFCSQSCSQLPSPKLHQGKRWRVAALVKQHFKHTHTHTKTIADLHSAPLFWLQASATRLGLLMSLWELTCCTNLATQTCCPTAILRVLSCSKCYKAISDRLNNGTAGLVCRVWSLQC